MLDYTREHIIDNMIADASYALVDWAQSMEINDDGFIIIDHYGDEVTFTNEDLDEAVDQWAHDILNRDNIQGYFVRAAQDIAEGNWDELDYDAVVVSGIFHFAAYGEID